MSAFASKAELYRRCSDIRHELGIDCAHRIRNTKLLLTSVIPSIKIDAVPFVTSSLRGMCSVGTNGKPDVILLNSRRSDIEQNFDCMHEFIHLHEHRSKQGGSFRCYDTVTDKQDHFLEWQSNEGSAEMMVPYQDFIPRFLRYLRWANAGLPLSVIDCLAQHYYVSSRVISIRLDSLAYEIDCYRSGIPLEQIPLLSKADRRRHGISTTNYEAHCYFPMAWDDVIGRYDK